MNHYSVLIVVLPLLFASGCNSSKNIKFDSDIWKNGNQEVRGSMIRDLLGVDNNIGVRKLVNVHLTKESILYGKNKKEIIELLGTTKYDTTDKKPDENSYRVIDYYVGYLEEGDSWFWPKNPFSLTIEFNSNDTIKAVHVWD